MEKYGVGTKHITHEGYEIEIVEKLKNDKRRVIFEDGYEAIVKSSNIGTGNIKNPYRTYVYGVGYFGLGNYKTNIKYKVTPEYSAWNNMLKRCYDKTQQELQPTYKGVIVCKDWYNFQNFAKWYNDNHPKIEEVKFHLDKDLLQENVENKLYSPETCIFLPCSVNSFLANKKSSNTSGYTGVSWDKTKKKWIVNISLFGEGKYKTLGRFYTIEEASESYQQARAIEAEKAKEYLRSLNYLPEEVIQLIK